MAPPIYRPPHQACYQTGLNAPQGAYTFSGSGGANIGAFHASFTVTAPFTVTNLNSLASINRAQAVTVNWTGGYAGGVVQIVGSAGAPAVKFICYASVGAGQFTVPPSILLGMPPGPGSVVVSNATAASSITASGLDIGIAGGVYGANKVDTTYK